MPSSPDRAVVIGGGVSGLTTAKALASAGFRVEVWSREPAERSTSAVAAALWYPYKAGPAEKVAGWSLESLEFFRGLAGNPATGVRMRAGLELFPAEADDAPWRGRLPGLVPAAPGELPPGYRGGLRFEAPVVEMPVYLPWLRGELLAAGVRILPRAAASLEEALAEAPLVVHCAGLAARELVRDPGLVPVRGQVVRVEPRGVVEFTVDDFNPAGITYVVPRTGDCVLGGSAQEGREDLQPDPAEAEAILRRCRRLVPALEAARVLSIGVGLRPFRSEVRVEREERGGGVVVHNYGHGGAGVTLSWGCAREAVRLARAGGRSRPGARPVP